MAHYIISIDQSTAATKAILFNDCRERVHRVDLPHRQIHLKPDWVEHDPEEIFNNVLEVIRETLFQTGVLPEEIAALSITNQRETTLLWNAEGPPVANAIVWQCARAKGITDLSEIKSHKEYIESATGLTLSPYFSAAKARWIYDRSEVKKDLFFGTMDSWLIYKLTGEHFTDYSNASRTQLFNIHTQEWDREILRIFGLEQITMPTVLAADAIFGYTTANKIFKKAIPIIGVMGDSQAALFGHKCLLPGTGKVTFGTGSSVMLNIGELPKRSKSGLATSIAWKLGEKVDYVFEGNINCSGDTIRWLVDELGILPSAKLSAEYAQEVPSTNGVYIVPAFVGLGAPYWDSDARAMITGLFRSANKYHVVRAAVESMAYQVKDILEVMQEESGMPLREINADGGPSRDAFLMQFLADILGTEVVCKEVEELSALGVASIALDKLKLRSDMILADTDRARAKRYRREMPVENVMRLYGGWLSAVDSCLRKQKNTSEDLC
jgi:glycerol kinase